MRRVGLVLVLMTLWVLVGVPRLVGAAGLQATPTAAGCDVEAVEIRASPEGEAPEASPEGEASTQEVATPAEGPAADPETIAALQATLDDLRTCVESGEIGQVAALFSPDGFAREVLAEEPVQIEPIPDGDTPVADGTTRVPPVVEPGVVDRAVVLEDGSVAAYVDVGTDAPALVVFVRDEADRWVIDAIEPLTPDASEGTPVRSLGAENVPAEVWDAVVATLGLTGDATITVVVLEAVDWPDSSLGCPEDGMFYAQVITPGYRIVVDVDGERTVIHTDLVGNAATCGD
jgi:hypothetical protein